MQGAHTETWDPQTDAGAHIEIEFILQRHGVPTDARGIHTWGSHTEGFTHRGRIYT